MLWQTRGQALLSALPGPFQPETRWDHEKGSKGLFAPFSKPVQIGLEPNPWASEPFHGPQVDPLGQTPGNPFQGDLLVVLIHQRICRDLKAGPGFYGFFP